MASTDGIDEVREESNFPPADIDGTLNPGRNNQVQVDPISSEVAVSKEKEQAEIKRKKKEKEDAMHTIKSAIIISGIIVAVAGAVFAITKKLKEK